MKRLATTLLIASSLVLFAPATFAKGPDQPGYSLIELGQRNLVKGFHYYVETVGAWVGDAFRVFAVGKKLSAPGDACQDQSECPPGLACLNACLSGKNDCDTLIKRCVKGPNQISVIGAYGACTSGDVCAKGTTCQRVCPAGTSCSAINICVPEEPVGPTCKTDDQCLAGCLAAGLPPVGGLALHAACETGYCYCHIEAIAPGDLRVACPDGQPTFACPKGTHPACTTGGRGTCLLSPEFGGHCQGDTECSKVGCADGLAPFCDKDTLCRCRGAKNETVSCTSDNECGGINCDIDQKKVCQAGSCSCAATKTSTCNQDSQCSAAACPSGYTPACINSGCACQRTVQAPVSCTDVSQCGSISCPAGYNKDCISSQCACSRTRTE